MSRAQLSHLPLESLEAVLSHLSRADLAAVASTSRFFRSMAARIMPGLKLSLYAHQACSLASACLLFMSVAPALFLTRAEACGICTPGQLALISSCCATQMPLLHAERQYHMQVRQTRWGVCGQLQSACLQRAAVRWLLERESANGPAPDPYWRALKTADGLPFWISDTCGDFTTEQPPQPQDIKGGFLCDEPGDCLLW